MIRARVSHRPLAAKLAARAERVAQAQASQKALKRRGNPLRWRLPALLWPLFTKD